MVDQQASETTKWTILYYPSIRVPAGAWLRRTLLYWDEVASIVPATWVSEGGPGVREALLASLSDDVRFLLSEGVYRPVTPWEERSQTRGWSRQTRETFSEEFIETVQSEQFQRMIRLEQSGSYSSMKTTRIHADKISYRELDVLTNLGLARHVEGREDSSTRWYLQERDWYHVERRTALLYMSLLAKHIADRLTVREGHLMVAGTDREVFWAIPFQPSSEAAEMACLDVRLLDALPVPGGDTPLEKILEFRNKRRTELFHFRTVLDSAHSRIAAAQDPADVARIGAQTAAEIQREAQDLGHLLDDGRLGAHIGTLKTLVGVKTTALAAALALFAGQATEIAKVPVAYTLAGLAVYGLIEVGSHLIDKRNERRATLRKSPFAYLYEAKQERIIY